jgi:hypothetical protein
MSFTAIDAWWWPFLYILIAGWLATDGWRFLGVFLGGRISEQSDILVLVRAIATALVAAVVSGLVVTPSGALAAVPIAIRIGATLTGFAVYLASRHHMLLGILAGETVLIAGMLLTG